MCIKKLDTNILGNKPHISFGIHMVFDYTKQICRGERMKRRVNLRRDGWRCKRPRESMKVWKLNEWINERMNEWNNNWLNESNQRMNKWMDRWKKKIDTTCLELNLNLWTEPATDKKFTHRCEFAVNSARHWAHFDMNKKQSSLRPPMSCVLLVYAVYFSLLIFSNHFLQKNNFCVYVMDRC